METDKDKPEKQPVRKAKKLGDIAPAGYPVTVQKPPMFSTNLSALDVLNSDSF